MSWLGIWVVGSGPTMEGGGIPYVDMVEFPAQNGLMKNLLFVCSANRLRSPTAEQVFSTWPGVETDSAGLNASAEQQLSTEQVEWADIIS